MNSHVHRYYSKFDEEDVPLHLFHEVIALHENPDFSWDEVVERVPNLVKGWYELARLSTADRIEFTREFWLRILPYSPRTYDFIERFFSKLDDVGVYFTQLSFDSPFEAEIVYSFHHGNAFFHGSLPRDEEEIGYLREQFAGVFPEPFLSFLKIHDGFSKNGNMGIISSMQLQKAYDDLQKNAEDKNLVISCNSREIDPADLIPFSESAGSGTYQCFYIPWSPEHEIGNVCYAPSEQIISDIQDKNFWPENLAFPTFLGWLAFYLEGIE
jgi:hypothetical protein